MGRIAFLFPGQGAQHVGMGKVLFARSETGRKLFELADRVLGFELSRICFEGPEERLNATDISQPAIFLHSAALLTLMRELPRWQGVAVDVTAGLSLGEYTALYAAGAMDFQTALKLVAQRGRFMQDAAVAQPSGMVAFLGLDEDKATQLCVEAADGQVLTPANFNCPGQVVISGHLQACERAAALAEKYSARAVPLKVAGAFHTQLMAPAAEKLAAVIAACDIRPPTSQVIANVTARPYESVEQIRAGLVEQVTQPVRWQQSMERLIGGGVDRCYEIGPGRVLTGFMKKIDRGVEVVNVNNIDAVAATADGR